MIRLILLLLLALAAGYFLASDKPELVQSIKNRIWDLNVPELQQPHETKPVQDSPEYSDRDRKQLDSIVNDAQR